MLNFMYGTAWKEDTTKDNVICALDAGYRGIDTANQRKHYNEPAVGEALLYGYENFKLKRQDIFLQSKYTYPNGQDHRIPYDLDAPYHEQVRQSFQSTLKNLHTDYRDSYLLHGPFSSSSISDEDREVWREMETLVKNGFVKTIGLSNVTPGQLKEIYEFAEIKPAAAQIRCFAQRKWEKETRDFCKAKKIIFQGFSLLTANRDLIGADFFENEDSRVPKLVFDSNQPKVMREISNATDMSPAQIIFKFCHQIGILPITGTTNPDHMTLNLKVKDFKLSDEQVKTIENIAFY